DRWIRRRRVLRAVATPPRWALPADSPRWWRSSCPRRCRHNRRGRWKPAGQV
ncbi:MAG: hypothetical protein AVDCRST_MAG38-383, partial [uncultured Solirubrobacteraceae bacterium]